VLDAGVLVSVTTTRHVSTVCDDVRVMTPAALLDMLDVDDTHAVATSPCRIRRAGETT